ncbi:MAG: asparagine synthase-related protein [Pseudomonadota bacterium]
MLLDLDLAQFKATVSDGFMSVGNIGVAITGYCHLEDRLPEQDQCVALAGAFKEFGPDFSRSLLGQYSAIIIDEPNKQVVLAQDSLGLGRVSFGITRDRLVAGTDAREVARCLGITQIDEEFFKALIATGKRPARKTPFQGVRELSYGDTCIISGESFEQKRPWQPPRRILRVSESDAQEMLQSKLDLAVARAMPRTGVTMIELSGGLDSSSVAATARRHGQDIELISYLSERGMSGNDTKYARVMAEELGLPWHKLDPDVDGIVSRPSTILHPEPGSRLYSVQLEKIAACVDDRNSQAILTGAGGDIVFDYRGLVPVYLADPLVRGGLIETVKAHRRHAAEYGNNRAWTHRFRYTTLPFAAAFFRQRNMLRNGFEKSPDWLTADCENAAKKMLRLETDAPGLALPSQTYLWDHLFDLAHEENRTFSQMQPAPVFHPLLDRELAEFLIALPKDIRRGRSGDRSLQRNALGDRLPTEITTRKTKGSNTELRERHMLESDAWYHAMSHAPQIVARGWVAQKPWSHAIDRARAGAPLGGPEFVAAMECELWLQDFAQLGLN